MRLFLTIVAVVQFFSFLVSAHPFVIISTQITEVHIQKASPTHHYERRQDFFSDLASVANSLLGITDDATTSTSSKKKKESATSSSVRTLLPPAVASTTTTADDAQTTSSDDDQSTSSDDATTTSSAEPSTTSDVTSTTTTDASSSTTIPAPTPSLGNSSPTSTAEPSKSDNDNGVPSGGIAVAVIMSLLIAGLAAWLVFRYHPKCRAWWLARKEKQFQERSYRDAIDGPSASTTPNLRQQALGGAASKRQTLKSFFAPATVKLGDGQEIRRKPVNWGVASPSMAQTGYGEKALMAASAAPMGESEKIPVSPQPTTTTPATAATPAHAVSPATLNATESLDQLPPVSPLSSHRQLSPISAATAERDLPSLPPVPGLPYLSHAKKGSDGVFRLG